MAKNTVFFRAFIKSCYHVYQEVSQNDSFPVQTPYLRKFWLVSNETICGYKIRWQDSWFVNILGRNQSPSLIFCIEIVTN